MKTRTAKKTRRQAAHTFALGCECEMCRDIYSTVAAAEVRRRSYEKMMTPVTHRVYDNRYLDNLMTRLGVPDEARADVHQAFIDTAEPGKSEIDWICDATFVVAVRRGFQEPPPGSPGAKYLHPDPETVS